jgi:hypothetical protein
MAAARAADQIQGRLRSRVGASRHGLAGELLGAEAEVARNGRRERHEPAAWFRTGAVPREEATPRPR